MLRRRREAAQKDRVLRFEALRAFVAEDLPAEIVPHADVTAEQPERFPGYHVRVRIAGLAEIRALYHYREADQRWLRRSWHGPFAPDWAVVPRPGMVVQQYRIESELDAALALALDFGAEFHACMLVGKSAASEGRGSKVLRMLGWGRRAG